MSQTPATRTASPAAFRAAGRLGAAALLMCAAAASAPASAQSPQPQGPAPGPTPSAPDYRDGANWLCRPGRQDACGAADLTATRVAADGRLSPVAYTLARAPAVDCFYVYPTVSHDTTPNSDMTPGPEERGVVQQQFARFGSVCRTYAPMYRQVTLTALQAAMLGHPVAADRNLPYEDVKAAWNDYLAHDNGGRGFVLIGHSQGSGVLTRLIKEEIDGKPVAKRMVSAILGGTSLAVPAGKDVGGAFTSVPLCHSTGQTGCVVAFASFRASSPPPANSRFGRIAAFPGGAPVAAGMVAACVNPAAPGGGRAELHPFMAAGTENITAVPGEAPHWVAGQPPLKTAFASTPGLYSAQCVNEGGFNYLSIGIDPNPADVRRDAAEHTGDVVVGGGILKDWGLHLIDMNLTMGDMTRLVTEQAAAYAKGR